MRNIDARPITKEEVQGTLDRLIQEELASERVGGTDAVILSGLKGVVQDLWEAEKLSGYFA